MCLLNRILLCILGVCVSSIDIRLFQQDVGYRFKKKAMTFPFTQEHLYWGVMFCGMLHPITETQNAAIKFTS